MHKVANEYGFVSSLGKDELYAYDSKHLLSVNVNL